MAYLFTCMILALILFGRTIEQRIDARIVHIYETGIDDDTRKTFFAIHFYDIWMGLASYFCLASATESIGTALHGNENQLGNYFFGLIAIAACIVCAKITRMFYRTSSAREQALDQYLANN